MIQTLKRLAIVLMAAVSMAACNGCQNNPDSAIQSPTAAAESPEQHAYALYGQFVIAEEAGAKLTEHPSTPSSVKQAIATADAAAKPIADNLLAAARDVMVIRAQLRAGTSTEEKLAVAIANLDKWVSDLRPKLEELVGAVETPARPE